MWYSLYHRCDLTVKRIFSILKETLLPGYPVRNGADDHIATVFVFGRNDSIESFRPGLRV